MVKPCVYIDYAFFKHLLKKGNENANPLLRKSQTEYHVLLDFLFDSGIEMIFHIDEDETDEYDLIRVLEDYHVQGKLILKLFSKELFDNELNDINQRSPFCICFLASPEKRIEELISTSGFICISKKNFDTFLQKPYFKKNTFEVAKDGDISGWHDFGKLSHTFNSIVIFDRYLFANHEKSTRSGYKETLAGIIKNLLSKNNSKTIYILVSAPEEFVSQDIDTLRKNIENSINESLICKKEIIVGLTLMRRKLPINHDRIIFTNLMVLSSGDSFNYFKSGVSPTIETVLTTYSIIDWSNTYEAYLRKLQKLKTMLPSIDKVGVTKIRSGHCDIEFLQKI